MGFYSQKKAEHEAACEAAIKSGDTNSAVFHAAKAAEFCYALAKDTPGPVSASYVATAEGWLEIAEKGANSGNNLVYYCAYILYSDFIALLIRVIYYVAMFTRRR